MVKTTYNLSSVELLTDIHRHKINNKEQACNIQLKYKTKLALHVKY